MNVTLVTVPYDHDIARWGCASGPQALLDAGIVDVVHHAGHEVVDTITVELPREMRTRDTITNLGRIGAQVSDAVAHALAQPHGYALVLAGNCPHAVGAAGGLARSVSRPGIVWFDAHGDLQTYATTETGFIGGMPFAVCLGWDLDDWRDACGFARAVAPEAAVLIGGSDIDAAETEAIARHGIGRLDAADLDGDSAQALLIERRANADGWYLHLDVDIVGSDLVPGHTVPSPHPARGQDVIASLRAATATLPVRVATIATYNSPGDPDRRGIPFIFACVEAILDDTGA